MGPQSARMNRTAFGSSALDSHRRTWPSLSLRHLLATSDKEVESTKVSTEGNVEDAAALLVERLRQEVEGDDAEHQASSCKRGRHGGNHGPVVLRLRPIAQ